MKVSIFQGPLAPGSVDHRLAALQRAAAEASSQGANLLIAPELFLTGYNIGAEAVRAQAQPADGAASHEAAAIALTENIALLYGYPERDGSRIYNSALLIDRTGAPQANFRKLHLWGDIDKTVFTPGEDPAVMAEIDGVKIGILICYDVEFPELVRGLALRGADLIAVPTAQMQPFEFVSRSLIPTRAYENSVFVAYANHCGTEGELIYTGESCIAAPDGTDLARAGTGEMLITADLDPALLAKARSLNTFIADRRPTLYGALTEQHR
jgi:predicted amidohydrolase